jgi:hypothetical protein
MAQCIAKPRTFSSHRRPRAPPLAARGRVCRQERGTLTRNAAAVHAPPRVVAREIEILKAEQITDVLAKLDGHTLFPIASLALATGLTPRRAARTAMGRYRLGWRHASRRAERRGDAVGLKSEATKDGEG